MSDIEKTHPDMNSTVNILNDEAACNGEGDIQYSSLLQKP